MIEKGMKVHLGKNGVSEFVVLDTSDDEDRALVESTHPSAPGVFPFWMRRADLFPAGTDETPPSSPQTA